MHIYNISVSLCIMCVHFVVEKFKIYARMATHVNKGGYHVDFNVSGKPIHRGFISIQLSGLTAERSTIDTLGLFLLLAF